MLAAFLIALVTAARDGGVDPREVVHVIRIGPSDAGSTAITTLSETLSEAQEMVSAELARIYSDSTGAVRVTLDAACDNGRSTCVENVYRVEKPLGRSDLYVRIQFEEIDGLWNYSQHGVTEIP